MLTVRLLIDPFLAMSYSRRAASCNALLAQQHQQLRDDCWPLHVRHMASRAPASTYRRQPFNTYAILTPI